MKIIQAFVNGKEVEIKKITKRKVTLKEPPPKDSVVEIRKELK